MSSLLALTTLIGRIGCVSAGLAYPLFKTYTLMSADSSSAEDDDHGEEQQQSTDSSSPPSHDSNSGGSGNDNTQQQYELYLTYWMCYSLIFVMEYLIGDLLLERIGIYYELKLLVILYLLAPQTQGSLAIYRRFIEPRLSANEELIDTQMEIISAQLYAHGLQYIVAAKDRIKHELKATAMKVLSNPDNQARLIAATAQVAAAATSLPTAAPAAPAAAADESVAQSSDNKKTQ